MKLRKLHLQNYKVFDDAEFDFTDSEGKTLDTIVLAGANGCGKTTVLELLADLFSHSLGMEQKSFIKTEWEVQQSEKKDIYERLISNLKNNVNNGITSFSQISFITNQLSKYYPNFSFDEENSSLVDLFSFGLAQNNKIWSLYFPVSKPNKINTNSIFTLLHLDSHKSNMESTAIKAIQKEIFQNKYIAPQATIERSVLEINDILSDFNLSSKLIDIESEHFVFQSLNGKKLYFEELSNGEKHLYFNAIYLHNLKLENCIILVDEPEIALHPSWQKAAVKFYEKIGKNNQVILATHSPHIMASVKPESLFVLHLDKEHNKVQVLNMEKEGKHSKGLEPNRILTEIMEVETLREFETQQSINRLAQLLNIQQFESEEAQALLEKLQAQLGKQDSFIIRANHQMLMLNRQKEKQNALHS